MWKLALITLMCACEGPDDPALESPPSRGGGSLAERAVIADVRDGEIDRSSLLESALALSANADAARRTACMEKFAALVVIPNENSHSQVEHFIERLHQQLLAGPFDPECTSVADAFGSGRHNCVISLILTLEYCRRANISATGMQAENHVWLRLGEAGSLHLETTKLQVDHQSLRHPQPISDAQLLSRLLYNQARQENQAGKLASAVERLEWCLAIDPNFAPAERNLRIVMGNWTAQALENSRFSEAAAVNRRAVARFPDDDGLKQHGVFLQQQWNEWRQAAAPASR